MELLKLGAMEIINEIEDRKRGIYSGAVGYFSSFGDMDTAIALRTAIIKDNKMYVQAGGELFMTLMKSMNSMKH